MVTWKELEASYRPHHGTSLDDIRSFWPELIEMARANDKAAVFIGMDNTLATLIAFLGPSRALADVATIAPALKAVLARMDPKPKKNDARYMVTILSVINAHRCGGLRKTTARADGDRERRWVATFATKPDTQDPPVSARGRAALIAVAVGLPELAVRIAHAEKRKNAERDLLDFAVQLASGTNTAAAWEIFLRGTFPGYREADIMHWIDLLWAARAMHVGVGRGRIADVGTWLQREVARAIRTRRPLL